MPRTLTKAAARGIVLKAQGLQAPRSTSLVTARDVGRTFARMQLVQIDSVNVLSRSHYLPFFSRLGPYEHALVDGLYSTAPRKAVEFWAHEASLIRPAHFQALQLVGKRRWVHKVDMQDPVNSRLAAEIHELLQASGPLTASQISERLAHAGAREKNHWGWNWNTAKTVLEYLFATGQISSAERSRSFERRYVPVQRVIPAPARNGLLEHDADAAHDLLVEASLRALGLGTGKCIADYFRLSVRETLKSLQRLEGAGVVIPTAVSGWSPQLYRHAQASGTRSAQGRALLSPFDPMVFERRRLEQLFDFRYRIEIYTPQERRQHGYYVLPFLLRDSMVARVDLKADRQAGVLRVRGAFAEIDAPADTARELAQEVMLMAQWLSLGQVQVSPHGDLAPALARELG